jgi:hypothetical protein
VIKLVTKSNSVISIDEQIPLGKCEINDVDPLEGLTEQVQFQAAYLRSVASALEHGRAIAESVALPAKEILEIIIDLSLILKDSKGTLDMNPEIFESPRGESDSLGNVLMIHKHYPRLETSYEALEQYASNWITQATLLRSLLDFGDRQVREYLEEDSLSSLYTQDIVALESREAAKRQISKLRSDNTEAHYSWRYWADCCSEWQKAFDDQLGKAEQSLDSMLKDYNHLARKHRQLQTKFHRLLNNRKRSFPA